MDTGRKIELGKLVFDMSMSLDGFVRASSATPEEPLGAGGERLHEWAFGEDERTCDDSIRWWGAGGPTGPARPPVFVVAW